MSIFQQILEGELSLDSIETLRNKRNLGQIDFEKPATRLENLRKILERAKLGEEFIHLNVIKNLRTNLFNLGNAIVSLKSLDPANGGDMRNASNEFLNQIDDFSGNIIKEIGLAVSMGQEVDQLYFYEQKSEVDSIVADMKSMRAVSRSQMNGEASSHSAIHFKSLGDEFNRSANRNEKLLVGTSIIFGGGLIAFEIKGGHRLNNVESLYGLFPYFNLVAIGWFAIRFISRNYRSNRNLAVINLTKSNILEAGEKFAVSARNDVMKDEITKLVVMNAFSTSESGLINQENESGFQIQGVGQHLGRILGGK